MMTYEIDYSNLDRRIRNDVCHELRQNEQTAPYFFRVGVLNAIVHLAGEVPSMKVWELAHEIAAHVQGVRGVVNRITAPDAPEPARTVHIYLKPEDYPSENGQEN